MIKFCYYFLFGNDMFDAIGVKEVFEGMGCNVPVSCRYKLGTMVSQDLPGNAILCKTHLKDEDCILCCRRIEDTIDT